MYLHVQGLSFAIQVVVFLILGSFADFGTWRPNILIGLSLCAFGIGFGWLGVHTESDWHVGVGLYIVGLIAYQTTVTFWTAAFPGLARNTKELRVKAEEFAEGRVGSVHVRTACETYTDFIYQRLDNPYRVRLCGHDEEE